MIDSSAADSSPRPCFGRLKRLFQSQIPESDQVPFLQKIAYGLGIPVEGVAQWTVASYLTPVLNIGFGMSPALIGALMMFWRFWDAFVDPIVGNISDNTRSRWGRRRPYIFVGGILVGLSFPLMWWAPRDLVGWQVFTWVLVSGTLFYTCYSVWAMPYFSLLLEMTPDYNERTNVTAVRSFIMQFVALGIGWIFAMASLPVFGILPDGKPDLVSGMRAISIGLAILAVIFGVLPSLFAKERYYQKEACKQPPAKLVTGLKQTLTTKPLLWLFAIITCNMMGFGLVGTLGFYVNAYYLCGGDLGQAAQIQGVKATMLVVPNILVIPFCAWLARRFGKRALLYGVFLLGIIGNLSIYIFYIPSNPWLQVIPPLIIGPSGIGLWLIVPSMYADIADYDELATGMRREGSIMAVASWLSKIVGTATIGISGLLLVWTGFDIAHGAAQPDYVLRNLKIFYIWIPVGFLVAGLFAIRAYDLTHKRMLEIRAELEARRGVI